MQSREREREKERKREREELVTQPTAMAAQAATLAPGTVGGVALH